MPTMTDRQCSKCLNYFPSTLDYFHTEGNNRGLRKECKACANARAKRWRETHKAYVQEQAKLKYAAGRVRSAAWRARNQERQREYNREYRKRKKVAHLARLLGVNYGTATV
jgi:hypothetical protein